MKIWACNLYPRTYSLPILALKMSCWHDTIVWTIAIKCWLNTGVFFLGSLNMWLFDLKQQINYIPVEHDWVRPIHQTFSINFLF